MKQSDVLIPAGLFKAQCLKLMEEAKNKHLSYIITKHGKPIAKLVPYETTPLDAFGCMKDTLTINGDIVNPLDDITWEAADE